MTKTPTNEAAQQVIHNGGPMYAVYCTACPRHCIKYYVAITQLPPSMPVTTGEDLGTQQIPNDCPLHME